jgi:hypothetical protein
VTASVLGPFTLSLPFVGPFVNCLPNPIDRQADVGRTIALQPLMMVVGLKAAGLAVTLHERLIGAWRWP